MDGEGLGVDDRACHRVPKGAPFHRSAARRRIPTRSSAGRSRHAGRSGSGRSALAERQPYDVDHVRQVLAVLLVRRCPDIHLVADTMLTSPRTLQRRLRDAGLTYARLMAETRREAAKKLLADPTRTIADVARTLGYSDPAHFTRAFQRWTGFTPRAYRALPVCRTGSDPHSHRNRRRR
jgi:AraC-like DNA-binding protein